MIRIVIAATLLLAFTVSADARQRSGSYIAHPDCNVLWPCAGVSPSPRGERIAKQVGFGAAQKVYTPQATPRIVQKPRAAAKTQTKVAAAPPVRAKQVAAIDPQIVAHPDGCPRRLFCGCGAAKRLKEVWGIIVEKPRELWLAANWYRFPRSAPAPGTVAVRRHHVYVIEAYLGDGKVLAYDANSGGGKTRIHVRSIAGYAIVKPSGTALL